MTNPNAISMSPPTRSLEFQKGRYECDHAAGEVASCDFTEWAAAHEARITAYQRKYAGMFGTESDSLAIRYGKMSAARKRERALERVPDAERIVAAAERLSGFDRANMLGCYGHHDVGRRSPVTWRTAAFTVCREREIPWLAVAVAMGVPGNSHNLMDSFSLTKTRMHMSHPDWLEMLADMRRASA